MGFDLRSINKQFMSFSKGKYEIVDIQEMDVSYGTKLRAIVCFVVKKDKNKEIFLQTKYDACCEDYLSFVKQFEKYRNYTYEFMLVSKEEVKRDYEGCYYYVMK